MFHFVLNIFFFFLIIGAGWFLFVAWVLGMIVRTVWIAFSRVTGVVKPPRMPPAITRKCAAFRCGAANPAAANFCRRCGAPFARAAAKPQNSNVKNTRAWASSPISL